MAAGYEHKLGYHSIFNFQKLKAEPKYMNNGFEWIQIQKTHCWIHIRSED